MINDRILRKANGNQTFLEYDQRELTTTFRRPKLHCDDYNTKINCSTILMRHSFEISEEKIYYIFEYGNWISCLADIGGFSKILLIFFGYLGAKFNNENMIYKQMRNLYFLQSGYT